MFNWLEKNLPKIVMAPAVGLIGWFVYGFVLWTLYISFTNSKILPKYELWGFGQYENCLLYTSPSPRDHPGSRMPSSA